MGNEPRPKTLIIVESPTKAKTIKKFLPGNCTVVASYGHIRELDPSNDAVDVDNGFKPHYVLSSDKKDIVRKLKDELADAQYLLLATDEDREGESISWHLLQVLKPKVPYRRMVFHEITKSAILKALEGGRELDINMVHAQEARRIIDRLFGYDVSSLVGSKLANRKLSAGRVQSPGLKLTVEREKQRILFKKSVYFDAKADLDSGKGTFEARLTAYKGKNLAGSKDFDSTTGVYKQSPSVLRLDEREVDILVAELKKEPYIVSGIESKPTISHPAFPFITSTLQQEAIRKLGFSSKETMSVAQRLYENGLITYMRTDSPTLSQEGINGAREGVEALYGKAYLSPSPRQFKAKSAEAQEAHEAIRPAGEHFCNPQDSGLKGKDLALYRLVWSRTMATQMADAKKNITTVKIKAGEGTFTASGTQIVFPGFLRAYVEGKEDPEAALEDKEKLLPALEEGQQLTLLDLLKNAHETKAPSRFTEASLVQELEKLGIGRPSTYATIIDTLLKRDYLEKDGHALVPTFVGFAVCQYLDNSFPQYVDYDFTRKMEGDLDKIAEEKENELTLLTDFYFGNDGLEKRIENQKKADDKLVAKTLCLPQVSPENPIMIGPYGPYVLGKEQDGKREYINLPKDWMPGTITDEDVKNLIKQGKQSNQPKVIGKLDGEDVLLCNGRFGPYWQLGQMKGKEKPKRASIPTWMQESEAASDIETATRYLRLPRILGNTEDGRQIIANKGKYGPYISDGEKTARLDRRDHDAQLFSIDLDEGLHLLAAGSATAGKGKGKGVRTKAVALKSFGKVDGQDVGLYNGRYGFYLKWGTKNVSLPAGFKKTEQKAMELDKKAIAEIIHKSGK
ncbi:MAG: type I DNA topoisomerase [Spirochaetia bacterium]|jgi:DNA topoisomerase-1|nr:type I DNA topoisomerase [Spirochaetia bacterium]